VARRVFSVWLVCVLMLGIRGDRCDASNFVSLLEGRI
jgi:hypothetical protein